MGAMTSECLYLYIINNETMIWMPSSKIPAFLIEEFETGNEASQSTSQPQERAVHNIT